MTDHSIRRRRVGSLLVGIAALALPLTASVTYAQGEVPVPPEAPVAPAFPVAPGPPPTPLAPDAPPPPEPGMTVHRTVVTDGKDGKERHVVVVRKEKGERAHGEGHEANRFHFRGKDGKPLHPDDPAFKEQMKKFEERFSAMDKDMKHAMQFDEKRLRAFAENGHKIAETKAHMVPRIEMSCDDDAAVAEAAGEDGRKVIRVCRKQMTLGAVGGLRAARSAIAGNDQMSAETRKEVLEKLDREIERLEAGK